MRLIDADALRDALGITGTADSCKGCKYNDRFEFACNTDAAPTFEYVCEMIDDAPTIEERKTGKWIIEPYDAQNDIFVHRCGTCMRVAMLGGHTTKFKFCPLCGSVMEGEHP